MKLIPVGQPPTLYYCQGCDSAFMIEGGESVCEQVDFATCPNALADIEWEKAHATKTS